MLLPDSSFSERRDTVLKIVIAQRGETNSFLSIAGFFLPFFFFQQIKAFHCPGALEMVLPCFFDHTSY